MAWTELQHKFLTEELALLTISAALATRSAESPIYARSKAFHQRAKAKDAIRAVLREVERHYKAGNVSEDNHMSTP
jgi:hypothetical protein